MLDTSLNMKFYGMSVNFRIMILIPLENKGLGLMGGDGK